MLLINLQGNLSIFMNSRKIFLLISHKKVVSNRNIITKRLCIIWKFVFPCFSQSFCYHKALDDICGEEIYCLGHIIVRRRRAGSAFVFQTATLKARIQTIIFSLTVFTGRINPIILTRAVTASDCQLPKAYAGSTVAV